MTLAVLSLAAVELVQAIGVWRVTTPDPATSERSSAMTAALIARWLIIVAGVYGVLALVADPAMILEPDAGSGANGTLRTVLSFGMLITSIAGAIGWVAMALRARALALRLPDESLAQATVVFPVVLLGSAMVYQVTARWGGGGGTLVAIVLFASGLIVLGAGLMSFVLVFQYRRRLALAARMARETAGSG